MSTLNETDPPVNISNLQIDSNHPQNDENEIESPTETTLFPKIAGKIGELIRNYRNANPVDPTLPLSKNNIFNPDTPRLISLTGTVKLHGTHADIVVYNDNTVRLQSRNRLSLDPENDNYGFAERLVPLNPNVLRLRDRVLKRFRKLNPGMEVLDEHPVIIAGEWVGPGVQRSSRLGLEKFETKCLVIISLAVNNKWLADEAYADIEDVDAGIYNISRGGFFHEILDFKEPQPCSERMMEFTLAVEKECPFSKSFGISGIGEGIVWKAAPPLGENAMFWVKTKGPLHRVSNTDDLNKPPPNMDARDKARVFAEAAVTEMRLQQGWDYLGEMGIEKDTKAIPKIMEWVCNDVLVEEKSTIEEMGIDKAALKVSVGKIARDWFLTTLKEGKA
ncbi:hypothetical protein VTL71DRAFT_16554 [Oculimacula yallundae]|uniref:RNA ligase domain-containing protein n=1 Tax=Oculimacula yallundae TaxID=86028 RepID=A0ABR4CER7_9HELO